MIDLKNNLQELGFENIRTYIQTGNIVFDTKINNEDKISEIIFDNIKKPCTSS